MSPRSAARPKEDHPMRTYLFSMIATLCPGLPAAAQGERVVVRPWSPNRQRHGK